MCLVPDLFFGSGHAGNALFCGLSHSCGFSLPLPSGVGCGSSSIPSPCASPSQIPTRGGASWAPSTTLWPTSLLAPPAASTSWRWPSREYLPFGKGQKSQGPFLMHSDWRVCGHSSVLCPAVCVCPLWYCALVLLLCSTGMRRAVTKRQAVLWLWRAHNMVSSQIPQSPAGHHRLRDTTMGVPAPCLRFLP